MDNIQPQYDSASAFSEGLAMAVAGGQYGFVDGKGKWVIPPSYLGASSFSDGLALVLSSSGTFGYMDKTAKWALQPNASYTEAFSDGALPRSSWTMITAISTRPARR
jgi:hypothetical protein